MSDKERLVPNRYDEDDLMSGADDHKKQFVVNCESINEKDEDAPKEKTDAERVGFKENMTTLQCFWLVTQIATPPILGMLVYLLV